jgi:hypothetical protein
MKVYLSIILIGKHESFTPFLSACVYRTRNSHIPLERSPIDLQKLIIIYIGPLGYALESFKVSMLILWKNCYCLMILAAVIENFSKNRQNRCFRKLSLICKQKQLDIFWSNEYNYLVKMIEFRPVDNLYSIFLLLIEFCDFYHRLLGIYIYFSPYIFGVTEKLLISRCAFWGSIFHQPPGLGSMTL